MSNARKCNFLSVIARRELFQSVGRAYFPIDYYHLLQSSYAQGKDVVFDTALSGFVRRTLEKLSIIDVRAYEGININELFSKIKFQGVEDIDLAKVKEGKIFWVTYGTQFGTGFRKEENQVLLKNNPFAVIAYSVLSGHYSAISIYEGENGQDAKQVSSFQCGDELHPDEIKLEGDAVVICRKVLETCLQREVSEDDFNFSIDYNNDIVVVYLYDVCLGDVINDMLNIGMYEWQDFVIIEAKKRILIDDLSGTNDSLSRPVSLEVDWLNVRTMPLSRYLSVRFHKPSLSDERENIPC